MLSLLLHVWRESLPQAGFSMGGLYSFRYIEFISLLPTDFGSPRFLMGNLLATGPSIPWCQVTAMLAVSQDSLFSFDRLTSLRAFKFIQLLIQFRESISISFYDLFSFFSSPGTFAVNIMVSWWHGSQRGYSFFLPPHSCCLDHFNHHIKVVIVSSAVLGHLGFHKKKYYSFHKQWPFLSHCSGGRGGSIIHDQSKADLVFDAGLCKVPMGLLHTVSSPGSRVKCLFGDSFMRALITFMV